MNDKEFVNTLELENPVPPVSVDFSNAEDYYLYPVDVYDLDLAHANDENWKLKYPKLFYALSKKREYLKAHDEMNEFAGMNPETTITLKIPGSRLNGAVIDLQWINKINEIAQKVGIPLEEALGLAARETTFGNPTNDPSIKKLWSKEHLKNAIEEEGFDPNAKAQLNIGVGGNMKWNQIFNYWDPYFWGDPFSTYMERYMFDRDLTPANEEDMEAWLTKYWQPLKRAEKNYTLEDPITGALKLFKTGNYNRGLKNHTELVKKEGKELMSDSNVSKYIQQLILQQITKPESTSQPVQIKRDGGLLEQTLEEQLQSFMSPIDYIKLTMKNYKDTYKL